MGGGAEFGICKEVNRDKCFAYVNGRCRILTSAEFGKRKCPFFKERGNKNVRKNTGSREEGNNVIK